MRRVYRYRLYPTRRQRRAIGCQLRAACDLYNAGLEQRREGYNRFGVSVGYLEQSAELRELRAEGLLDSTANFWSQQAVLRQLDRAFAAFFGRGKQGEKPGYPRYRSASRFDTLTWTMKGNAGGVAITDQGRLRLQSIGHVKVKWSRTVARRERGSHRRQKAAILLARQREREANRRRDHAHKLSRALADRYSLIAVENLRIGNMLRSAAGTVEQPGTSVAQKRSLNRAITDQGWAQFLSFLAYKPEEAGGRVIKVDPVNTSRTCAECGHVNARSRKAERFGCVACGHTDDADVNAARAILSRALTLEGIDRPGWGHQAKTAALAAVA